MIISKSNIKQDFLVNGIKVHFSNRELQCMRELCRGKTMKAIASCFGISPRTVESHFRNIKWKLQCNYKSQIIEFYLQEEEGCE